MSVQSAYLKAFALPFAAVRAPHCPTGAGAGAGAGTSGPNAFLGWQVVVAGIIAKAVPFDPKVVGTVFLEYIAGLLIFFALLGLNTFG